MRALPAQTAASRGFTLVEVLAVLVIAAFVGMLTVNLLGTGFRRSFTPVTVARDSALAESTMETIIAYYVSQVNTNTSTALTAVKAQFPNNSTVTLTDTSIDTVAGVLVTVTVNGQTLSTFLTQARTNAGDTNAQF
jgi:prepilin-type N-terminal cleavage/methylation domain-containing protein